MKSPIAKAWDGWINARDGQDSSDPKTLLAPEHYRSFLENRLWSAFMAGARAQEKISKRRPKSAIGNRK